MKRCSKCKVDHIHIEMQNVHVVNAIWKKEMMNWDNLDYLVNDYNNIDHAGRNLWEVTKKNRDGRFSYALAK